MAKEYDPQEEGEKRLQFDLRAIYAIEIVGTSLKEAMIYRKAKDFSRWYKALEDVKTVTKHNWDDKTNSLKEYNELVNKIKMLVMSTQTHQLVYSGAQKVNTRETSIIANQIEDAIRILEEFLYEKIEKLFGARYEDDEDEY